MSTSWAMLAATIKPFTYPIAVLCAGVITVHAQHLYTPDPGSPERQAVCDAVRAYVDPKYSNKPLPQPIVFKIKHLLVRDRFCNMEAIPIFKDGSNAIPQYMPDLVLNLCLERTSNAWRVVADLSRSDVPAAAEISQIRASLPADFPLSVLSPTWRNLLGGGPSR